MTTEVLKGLPRVAGRDIPDAPRHTRGVCGGYGRIGLVGCDRGYIWTGKPRLTDARCPVCSRNLRATSWQRKKPFVLVPGSMLVKR